MKKDERHTYIRNRAYELAYSGEGLDWLTIEHLIRAEGFEEARSLLDDNFIRKQLNDICDIANSPSEIKNREDLHNWIKEFIVFNVPEVKKSFPVINISALENKFSISTSNKELEISKIFNSRELTGDYFFEESDGHRYKSINYYRSAKVFDEFQIEDFIDLVKIVLK